MQRSRTPYQGLSLKTPQSIDFELADTSMLSSLLQKIGACLAGIDDILKGCGLSAMPMGVENSMHWCDDSGALKYHQNLRKFTLPFNWESSQQICWETFNTISSIVKLTMQLETLTTR
ncbi:hypothetical protein GQ600_20742 [Phytophthora cactorum]|nr:hypothetical protein GQ600_20742 [Phytophthora cactorum]